MNGGREGRRVKIGDKRKRETEAGRDDEERI